MLQLKHWACGLKIGSIIRLICPLIFTEPPDCLYVGHMPMYRDNCLALSNRVKPPVAIIKDIAKVIPIPRIDVSNDTYFSNSSRDNFISSSSITQICFFKNVILLFIADILCLSITGSTENDSFKIFRAVNCLCNCHNTTFFCFNMMIDIEGIRQGSGVIFSPYRAINLALTSSVFVTCIFRTKQVLRHFWCKILY